MADISTRGDRIKRSLIQSDYITATWTWFMVLAGKAAEPVLVASVLYASVKLLPIVHFAPQLDVIVFVAQFVALDIGGLSLNKLADQAKQEGNEEGANQAKHLSIALVAIMLTGVIMAGVDQVVHVDGQVGTIIDTILLIARAILAVLYSRVIHSLRDESSTRSYTDEELQARITDTTNQAVAEVVATIHQTIINQLSQSLEERLTMLDLKQADALAQFKTEQTVAVTSMIEAALHRQMARQTVSTPSKVRSITDAPSRRPVERDIDKLVWPLLNSGMTVRAIAERAGTSTATVGRSRKRWEAQAETSRIPAAQAADY